jgi:iron complex outermembrane receptor protein
LNGLFTSVFGALAHNYTDLKTREDHFEPQVVVQYDVNPNTMIYGKFVKGDKAGGVDSNYQGSVQRGLSEDDARFAPERATSFEAGIKGITADRKLEYTLTAFSTRFTNLQTSVFVGTSLFVTNAGRARSRGLETELTWAPTHGLRVRANGTWQNGKYSDYVGVACEVQGQLPVAPGGGCDLSGQRLSFLSKLTGSLGVEHGTSVSDTLAVEGGVSVVGKSRFSTALNNDPLGIQRGFATVDAHLALRLIDREWRISLFGRNLTDQNYFEYSIATPLIPGGYNVWLARGRQLGVRLSGRF